ncbi:hypothetical protein RD110_24560 [Rhodoferax koreense]|uniref:Alpha/beta hydrolase fold-3 domain-containing protein n=1 Tax=Rhodoferax koreensis TaxID=1842727 RepID=A0A1P8K1U4_9BURK|nr:alpha/beta hydrolase [Rhodoferax koreense]APW39984.1 hypothetical protein RD110_24560 [Rhodoferax koreense]
MLDQFQYVEGQGRPGFATLIPRFEALSAAAATNGRLDIRYGEAARECFDFFGADQPRATLVFFHAGYWQSRDKATFRFIAPAFTRHGVQVALVNYPLCPHVSIGHLVEAARRAVTAVRAHVASLGGGGLPLVAAGHSAGGHIAVELAFTRWASRQPPAPAIDAVVALSGIYDLAPLTRTTLNANLGLDAASALRHSPLWRVPLLAPPALFAVGASETPAFLSQTNAMHAAWLAAGHTSTQHVVADADHFTLLNALVDPDSSLQQAVVRLIDGLARPVTDPAGSAR